MKIIIIGCGKLGSGLAMNLSAKQHHVTVIDSNEDAFSRLDNSFSGEKLLGVGFDKEILEQAGIGMADALVACSKSDEANALIGRIARNLYRVPRVISRLYDPRKAEIYRSLGIQTICTTGWGVTRVSELLSYHQLDSVMTIGNSNVELVRMDTPALLVGKTVRDITAFGEVQVVSISRENEAFLPMLGTTFQKSDIIYLSVLSASMPKLKALLGLA